MAKPYSKIAELQPVGSHGVPQKRLLSRTITTALFAMAVGTTAEARYTDNSLLLEEVIVTATKRAEPVMDVPIALTAWSGDFLREANLDDIKGYDEAQLVVGYQSQGNWRLSAYIENLFDSEYFDHADDGEAQDNPYVQSDWGPARPRTFGFRVLWSL